MANDDHVPVEVGGRGGHGLRGAREGWHQPDRTRARRRRPCARAPRAPQRAPTGTPFRARHRGQGQRCSLRGPIRHRKRDAVAIRPPNKISGPMSDRHDVVVVGAGQAGLAMSRELTRAGVAHVVLERGRVGQTWRGRWDSFCLVTPNWSVRLPGHHYDGDDPDGFMPRDEIVAYLERYAERFGAPVREGVAVTSLRAVAATAASPRDVRRAARRPRRGARRTGAYQRPHRPAVLADAARRPPAGRRRGLPQPRGSAGGPGAGRRQRPVRAARSPRSSTTPAARSSSPAGARRGSPAGSGTTTSSGGRSRRGSSTDRRARCRSPARAWRPTCSRRGATAATTSTCGRCSGWASRSSGTSSAPRARRALRARPRDSVAWGDERDRDSSWIFRKLVAERGLPMPEMPGRRRSTADAPERLDLQRVRRRYLRRRVPARLRVLGARPGAFDDLGFPIHDECASTRRAWALLRRRPLPAQAQVLDVLGVGEDAAIVARGSPRRPPAGG